MGTYTLKILNKKFQEEIIREFYIYGPQNIPAGSGDSRLRLQFDCSEVSLTCWIHVPRLYGCWKSQMVPHLMKAVFPVCAYLCVVRIQHTYGCFTKHGSKYHKDISCCPAQGVNHPSIQNDVNHPSIQNIHAVYSTSCTQCSPELADQLPWSPRATL